MFISLQPDKSVEEKAKSCEIKSCGKSLVESLEQEEMADKNKSGDFYNRPVQLGAWAGFKQFLWNSETSQVMGRTSGSWGECVEALIGKNVRLFSPPVDHFGGGTRRGLWIGFHQQLSLVDIWRPSIR